MKKAISLLLALVMCLSLCACGGGNDAPETQETTLPPETEPKIKTIEISMDNWQDYFSIESDVSVSKNDFGELKYFFPEMQFRLKNEWASVATDMYITVQYTCTDAYVCWFTYNMDTGELIEGEKTDDYVSPALGGTKTMDDWRYIEDGISLWGNAHRDTLVVEGNIASIIAEKYSTVEILRIQGTITVEE